MKELSRPWDLSFSPMLTCLVTSVLDSMLTTSTVHQLFPLKMNSYTCFQHKSLLIFIWTSFWISNSIFKAKLLNFQLLWVSSICQEAILLFLLQITSPFTHPALSQTQCSSNKPWDPGLFLGCSSGQHPCLQPLLKCLFSKTSCCPSLLAVSSECSTLPDINLVSSIIRLKVPKGQILSLFSAWHSRPLNICWMKEKKNHRKSFLLKLLTLYIRLDINKLILALILLSHIKHISKILANSNCWSFLLINNYNLTQYLTY